MKLVNRNAKANLILSRFVFCAMIVFLYSCGSGGGGDDSSSGTGSVSFGLALQDQGTVEALNSQAVQALQAFTIGAAVSSEGQFECKTETYEIAKIEAQVFDENGELLAEGGPWDCEERKGTIGDIEAGENRIVKVFAKNPSGIVIFDGNSGRFTVEAGKTVDLGTITLNRVEVAPVANDDTATTDEDMPKTINVLGNDEDANGDTLTVSAVDPTSSKGATITDLGNGTFTYDPTTSATLNALAATVTSPDTFSYTVTDGIHSASAQVTVIVV